MIESRYAHRTSLHNLCLDLCGIAKRLYKKRYWFAFVIGCAAAAGYIGGLAPSYYESTAVVGLKLNQAQNSPYKLMHAGVVSQRREQQYEHLSSVLNSKEVAVYALDALGDKAEDVFGEDIAGISRAAMVDMFTRDLVRARYYRNAMAIKLHVRAADSALVRELTELMISGSEQVLQNRVVAEANATITSLQGALNYETDPDVVELLKKSIAVEASRGAIVGAGALEVIAEPLPPIRRSAPNRTLMLALALSMAIGAFLSYTLIRRNFWGEPVSSKGLSACLISRSTSSRAIEHFTIAAAAVLLFLLFYNITFIAAPSIPTTRIASVLLISILFLCKGAGWFIEVFRRHIGVSLLLFVVFIHSLIGYRLGLRDSFAASRVFETIYFVFISSYALAWLVRGKWFRFHGLVVFVTTLQASIHIFSFFSAPYRNWLASFVQKQGTYDLTYAIMPPGFSSGTGAAFSIVQALGLVSALILLQNSRKFHSLILSGTSVLLLLISCGSAGRTGLLICLIFMALFVVHGSAKVRAYIMVSLVALVSVFALYSEEMKILLSLIDADLGWQFNSMLNRSFEVFYNRGRAGSVGVFASMYVPPLSFETLFGTGVSRTLFGARHDSGYVMSYYALGLVMSVVFYGALLWLVLRLRYQIQDVKSYGGWVIGWIVALMFIVEVKEALITHSISFYAVSCLLTYRSSFGRTDSVRA